MRTRRSPLFLLVALGIFFSGFGLARALTPTTPGPSATAKAKADSAGKAYAQAEARLNSGLGTPEAVYIWSRRWAEAQRANGVTTAVADHTKRMIALETSVKTKVSSGLLSAIDEHAAAWYRAEAEGGI